MTFRQIAPAVAVAAMLAAPAYAAEPGSSSWSGYAGPVITGAVIGAVAVPYLFPAVAPSVGGALVTTGNAVYTAVPAVGTAALDTVAAAGGLAAGATEQAGTYVISQTTTAQAVIGAAVGGVVGWLYAK